MKKAIVVIMATAAILLTCNIAFSANVAIYVWSGANSEHLLALFRAVEATGHTPYGIGKYDIVNTPDPRGRLTTDNFKVLILPAGENGEPGGHIYSYDTTVTPAMKSAVQTFVFNGGGFVGIEAGANFASSSSSTYLGLYTGTYTETTPAPGIETFNIVASDFQEPAPATHITQDAYMSDGGGTFPDDEGTAVLTNSSGDTVAVSTTYGSGHVILTAMDLSLRSDSTLDWTIWDNWGVNNSNNPTGPNANSEGAWRLLARMIDWAIDGSVDNPNPDITSSNPSGGQKVAVMSTHNDNGGAWPGLIPAVGKSIRNAGHIPLAIRGVDVNTTYPAVIGCPTSAAPPTNRLTFPEFNAVVFPGGVSWGYFYDCDALQNAGMTNVRDFVADGGGLLGLCAGAYLGADKIVWNGDTAPGTYDYDPTDPPLFYLYPMDLYGGLGATALTDTGPLFNSIPEAQFDVCSGGVCVYKWVPTNTTVDDIVLGFNSVPQQHFYYGGGAKTNLATDVKPVATYDALSGQVNAVRFKRGKGRVLLVGTHPEARSDMEDWLYWNDYEYDSSTPIDAYNGWGFIDAALNRWLLLAERGTPAITTPAPGSTLSGSTVIFSWSANSASVSEWWLYAGTSLGSSNIHNSGSLGNSTSTTVSGLPTDGSTLYVRLWYKIGASWFWLDYTYTAGATPSMTSPTPGAALSGSSQTFYWSANGASVTEWWLWVGTNAGSGDIYDSGSLGTATSHTVSGLPTDGSTLYVRLWYKIGASWFWLDYTYTAGAPPSMTSPTPGSTLSGSAVTFSWSANGVAVSEWWLYVGTSLGGNNLHNSGSLGSSTSTTVSGLPTDGSTVHVRLWYQTGGSWESVDAQYTTGG